MFLHSHVLFSFFFPLFVVLTFLSVVVLHRSFLRPSELSSFMSRWHFWVFFFFSPVIQWERRSTIGKFSVYSLRASFGNFIVFVKVMEGKLCIVQRCCVAHFYGSSAFSGAGSWSELVDHLTGWGCPSTNMRCSHSVILIIPRVSFAWLHEELCKKVHIYCCKEVLVMIMWEKLHVLLHYITCWSGSTEEPT